MSSLPAPLPYCDLGLVAVIDADPRSQRSTVQLLQKLGARVEVHASGADFLATVEAHVPAGLVAEARLADMPAADLISELRHRGLQIPTIILSTDADIATAVAVIRAGAIDFVERPFLDQAIRKHAPMMLGTPPE